MKKIFLSLMIMLLSVALFAQPQLSYRFANPQLTNGDLTLEFDVEIKADVPGYFLGEHTLSFVYSTDGFGAGIYPDNIYFSKGTLMTGEFFGSQMYDSLGFANTFPNTFSVSVIPLLTSFPPGITFQNEIPTDWIDLMHFELTIADPPPGGEAGIAFAEFLMNGQQYYYGPGVGEVTPCLNPNLFEATFPPEYDMMTYPLPGGGPTPIDYMWVGGTAGFENDFGTAANWLPVGVPGAIDNIEIPGDKAPLCVIGAAVTVNNINISGGQLAVGPLGTLDVTGTFTNTGFFGVTSDATGASGSFIPGPVAVINPGGTFNFWRTLVTNPGGPLGVPDEEMGWHYVSTPVNNSVSGDFTGYWVNDWTENGGAWNALDPTDDPCDGLITSTCIVPVLGGVGYSVKLDPDYPMSATNCPIEYIPETGDVVEFGGDHLAGFAGIGLCPANPTVAAGMQNIHDGDVPVLLGGNNLGSGIPGSDWPNFNLVGNPYPSGWDATNVLNSFGAPGSGLLPTIHYWDEATHNYASWNITLGGVNGGTPFVAPTQAFFLEADGTVPVVPVTITDADRTHMGATGFYKEEVSDIVRLLVSGNNSQDETVVHFMETASNGFDPVYDAKKLKASVVPTLYTMAGDIALAGNSLPSTTMVPVYFEAGLSTSYTIEATETSEFQNVVLEDLLLGTQTDLLQDSYTFDYTVGENNNRFLLHFTPLGTPELSANSIQIWSNDHKIYVQAPEIDGDIVVFNMMGQQVIRTEVEPGLNILPVNDRNAYFVVKVISSDIARTGKVYVK